jgi:hypothetical protein
MKTLEKVLSQAKKEEHIVIDESFKQDLKRKILSSRPQETIWWKRLVIVFVPLAVTIVMFFYYYQGDMQQNINIPSVQKTAQDEQQEKQSASVFSNRTMENDPAVLSPPSAPSGLGNTKDSISRNMEEGFGVSPSTSLSMKNIKTSPMPQNIDISFILLGGVILLALLTSLLFWYLTKRKR